MAGALVVVVNGVPGVTERLVPHWRGDLLLILSGRAYASYTLLGRRVLDRHTAGRVTRLSILWGALTMLPLALGEWLAGQRPVWTQAAVAGTLYRAQVVTALGYLVWNWALLGVGLLGEPLTLFTLLGGGLIVGGVALAFGSAAR